MTNTPMTSREAFEATYPIPSWAKYFKSTNEYICESQQWIDACQKLNAKWEGWQACQAHNDDVIAELREDFLDLRKQVNYRCADVQRLTELNIELVEALERLDGWLEARHLGGLMPNEKALIAKHKKV